MKLTPFILVLPFLILFTAWSGGSFSQEFRMALFVSWLLSIIACFGWGVYISRQRCFLGWLCVAVGLVHLIMFLLPVLSHVKIHT
jgi:hypothetical protein